MLVDKLIPAEPQGKPKNTGVSGLFILQQIFSTQELNQGLLHCRPIKEIQKLFYTLLFSGMSGG